MKLWKCEPYMPDNKGLVWAVVMAETRQQAIEKASARLLTVLGQWFPDDDYRRFAQLGSDHLDSTLEEVPEEAAIFMVPSPPSLEDGTQAPQPEAPAGGLKLSQPELRSRSATHETLPPRGSSRVAEGKGRNCYRDAEPRRAALFHGWDCILGLMRGGRIRLRGQVDVSDSSPVMEPGLGAAYPGRRRPG